MESSLGCSRGQRVVGPAHRLGQWQRVEVSEGPAPAWLSSDSFTRHHKSSIKKVGYTTITQYHYQSHLTASIKYIAKCTSSVARGTVWDVQLGRAHVPPEVICPRIGRHEDCRERHAVPVQTRLRAVRQRSPRLPWEQRGAQREAGASGERAPIFGHRLSGQVVKKNKASRERVRPLRGRSAHVALAVSEGQTTLRGYGGRGAAWPLTASEGQGLGPLETG